jgi:phosphatidylglycerol:prolipoprotein diacylglycerol transferase
MWQDIIRLHLPFNLPIIGNELVIHGFGVAMVVGFLIAVQVAKTLARRSKLDPEIFVNAALIALFTGILGARMSHVFENWSEFTDPRRGVMGNIAAMFNIASGGLTYYGGFLLAFPTLVLYAIWKKVPLRLGMDIIAPCLMIGLGFGRVGCFLNGCCYGAQCSAPWAVTFPYNSYAYDDEFHQKEVNPPDELKEFGADNSVRLRSKDELLKEARSIGDDTLVKLANAQRSLPVLPAQLYSRFTALLLACFLIAYYTVPHVPGHVFAAMMVLEGISRYTLELLRVEPAVIGNMSLSMVLGIAMVAMGLCLWYTFSRMGGRTDALIESLPDHLPATA